MPTLEPAIIDPRRHDAVLFDAALDSTEALIGRLRDVGVDTGTFTISAARSTTRDAAPSSRPTRRSSRPRARPGSRWSSVSELQTPLRPLGADTVVADLDAIAVRTGDRRMSQLPDALQALGDGLTTGQPAVFFDFDGTLSDIVDDPDSARLVAGAGEALQNLAAQCPVAVLSGRDLADVSKRVGLPGIWYAGSHGFELTAPDGTHHQNDAAAAAIPVLEQAAAQLREQLGSIPGVMVEHKRFGVAVHYRNAARDRVGQVAAAVRAAGQRDALRVTTGREVIELRPDIDWDKGKTLRWVIDHLQRAGSGSLVPIYLGDDITDEDAFDAVRDGTCRYTDPGAAPRRWRPGHRRAVRAGQSGLSGRVHRPAGRPIK